MAISVASGKQFCAFAQALDVLYLRVLKLLRIGPNFRLTTPKACQRIDIDVNTKISMPLILFFITLLFMCSQHGANAQFNRNYTPLAIEDTIPPAYLSALKKRLEQDKASITETNKAVSTSIREYLTNRTDYVVSTFNEDYIISNPKLTGYLERLLKNIYDANPQLTRETKVFVYRNGAINAVSFGEGTIALTLGLLIRAETEGQITFILCHELAHYHQKHSDRKIASLACLQNDKTFKKEVRSITRSNYGQFTKFSKLANSLELSITHHGRENEFEADSLALVMYGNLTADKHSPIRTLEILDSADYPEFTDNLDLKGALNTEAYPFKEQWLSYTQTNTWYASVDENDSTRTHPSCQRRIIALKRQMKSHPSVATVKDFKPDAPNEYSEFCRFENIASLYHFKRYGRSLFEALLLIERYPDNIYLHAVIGKCLSQHYIYQRNHELGKVLSLPDPRYPENYDRYLTFMHNLRLSELASLSYHYIAARKDRYSADEEFLYAWWISTKTGVGDVSSETVKKDYCRRFPDGKYITSINK